MNKTCAALILLGISQAGCSQQPGAIPAGTVRQVHVPCDGFPAEVQAVIDSGPWVYEETILTERALDGKILDERSEAPTTEFPRVVFSDKTLVDHLGCLLRVELGEDQTGYFYYNPGDHQVFLSKSQSVTSYEDLIHLMEHSVMWGVVSVDGGTLRIAGTNGIYADPVSPEVKIGTSTRTHIFSNRKGTANNVD